jgi:hypothetical protein
LQDYLKKEVNIAEAAEFIFVRNVIEGQIIRIIACNDEFKNDFGTAELRAQR